jgi:hypothetical protein
MGRKIKVQLTFKKETDLKRFLSDIVCQKKLEVTKISLAPINLSNRTLSDMKIFYREHEADMKILYREHEEYLDPEISAFFDELEKRYIRKGQIDLTVDLNNICDLVAISEKYAFDLETL